MEVSASAVKELREKTGAGMMDCKKALAESGGDVQKAIDYLRQKGLAAAAKKPIASRRMAPWVHMFTQEAKSESWWKSIAKPILLRAPQSFRCW